MRIEEVQPNRKDYVIAVLMTLAVISAVAGIIFWRMTTTPMNVNKEQRIAGALRGGAPEFESLRERIVVEDLVATTCLDASGGMDVELTASVRNGTGRDISALEVRGAIVARDGQSHSERTAIVMPAERIKISPNRSISVRLLLEDIDREAEQADVRMEVVGVRLD